MIKFEKIESMETIIRINRNKSAFKALILLAKELEKNDHTSSISISEGKKRKQKFDLITPTLNKIDLSEYFDQLSDFPTVDEIRKQAWPEIGKRLQPQQ